MYLEEIGGKGGVGIMEERRSFMLLPPALDACQVCATKHEPEQPHNRCSLYYQLSFREDNGRWPTWADAMAHCTPEMQEAWKKELIRRGLWEE